MTLTATQEGKRISIGSRAADGSPSWELKLAMLPSGLSLKAIITPYQIFTWGTQGFTDSGVSGLFGTSTSDIRRIGLVDVDVAGGNLVGALAGHNSGRVTESYANGTVSGIHKVGGLIGENGGTVANSHFTGSVSGERSVGGLVGSNGGAVTHSHANASVSGEGTAGG